MTWQPPPTCYWNHNDLCGDCGQLISTVMYFSIFHIQMQTVPVQGGISFVTNYLTYVDIDSVSPDPLVNLMRGMLETSICSSGWHICTESILIKNFVRLNEIDVSIIWKKVHWFAGKHSIYENWFRMVYREIDVSVLKAYVAEGWRQQHSLIGKRVWIEGFCSNPVVVCSQWYLLNHFLQCLSNMKLWFHKSWYLNLSISLNFLFFIFGPDFKTIVVFSSFQIEWTAVNFWKVFSFKMACNHYTKYDI